MRRAGTALAVTGLLAVGLAAASAQGKHTALPAIKHVFVIVLENESASTTFGPSSPAPYLANTLTSQGAFVPNYFGIGHASLDNYIAMISGQGPNKTTQADCQTFSDFAATGPLDSDGQLPGSGCVYPASVPTIAGQLDTAGLTWRGYMDGMGSDPTRESATCGHPAVGAADKTQGATATDQYATRHDPFVYFHGIIDTQSYCDSHVVALTKLAGDLATVGSTPNLSFITPSLCNDGHDTPCADGGPGGLKQVNTFLSNLVPQIEASPAYEKDGLIAIVFDESEGSDTAVCCGEASPGGGRMGAVLLSPFIAAGTTTQTAYNHYSFLRSLEDIFGLSHLGFAGTAGLTSFGADVFTAATAPPATTTTASTTTATTVTAKPKPAPCRAATTGAVLGTAAVGRTKTGSSLKLTARRTGSVAYTIRPVSGKTRSGRHALVACKALALALPAGHGTVSLSASAGKRHDVRTVKY